MTHSEMDELYELFILRSLEEEQASEIDRHLRDGCAHCKSKVTEAEKLMAAFGANVGITEPPADLKRRVLASIRPMRGPAANAPATKRATLRPTLYALAGLCAALIAVCIWLGTQRTALQSRLSDAAQERDALEAALKSLSRSGTKTIQFGKPNQPEGKVFVNPSGGLVFVANRLPRLEADRTLQLWLVPPAGAPHSAGIFRPDANGSSVTVSNVSVDPATTKAVAVSVEPAAGSSAPTTTPIIVAGLE